jgi:hypothetical protein
MAVDQVAVNETTWDQMPVSEPKTTYTAIVIWDGQTYSALCRELDIASCGDNQGEAFFLLKSAVREAVAVAAEKGIAAGVEVSNDALAEFLAQHKPPLPVAAYVFTA